MSLVRLQAPAGTRDTELWETGRETLSRLSIILNSSHSGVPVSQGELEPASPIILYNLIQQNLSGFFLLQNGSARFFRVQGTGYNALKQCVDVVAIMI